MYKRQSLYGSFAQCWLLSGGSLVGVTEDAVEEHGIETGGDVTLVGSVKEPNLEQIAALSPDYVILSADLTAHMELDAALTDMQIPHGYFRMDTFEDYDAMMQTFCALNDASGTLYEENVTEIRTKIEKIKAETAAALEEGEAPVSYTHLDVYKRQVLSTYLPICFRYPILHHAFLLLYESTNQEAP